MNQIRFKKEELSPPMQILALLGLSLTGAVIFGILAICIIFGIYGQPVINDVLTGIPTELSANSFKILLFISTSIGTFLVPALALAWIEKIPVNGFYSFKPLSLKTSVLVFILMIASTPFMEWVIEFNQNLHLPEFLSSLEEWMRRAEKEAMRTTYLLLDIKSSWDIWVNLIVVAVAPAVGEELMFRGGLQRTFGRMFRNPHISIWLTAIIFSAIHFQFLGFFPRLLLGAGFGYLYYWTKNLWYAIFAHFINNAGAVIIAWDLDRKGLPLDQSTSELEFNWIGYLLSFLATGVILYYIKLKAKKNGAAVDSDL